MNLTGIDERPALILASLILLAISGPGMNKCLASVSERGEAIRAGLWSASGLITGDTVWTWLALAASMARGVFDQHRWAPRWFIPLAGGCRIGFALTFASQT